MGPKSRMLRVYLVLQAALTAAIVSGCGGHSSSQSSASSSSSGSTIVITAANSVVAGQTAQLQATLTNSQQKTTDVTAAATWSSSNASVATVTATGLMTGVAAGTANISATFGGAFGSLSLTIGAAIPKSLTITPATPQLFTGAQEQFKASLIFTDGSTSDISGAVTWSVAPATVATISSTGLLQAVAAGSFTIAATNGAFTANASGTVTNPTLLSIAVSPATAQLASGATQQFTATGTYTGALQKDLTRSVTWASSNPSALTINAAGLATAASVAVSTPANVTAQIGSLSASVTVNVVTQANATSLVVKPTSSSIAQGSAQQQTATATYSDGTQQDVTNQVTWSVSASNLPGGNLKHAGARLDAPRATSTSFATVDQTGIAFANQPGAANVQASLGALQAQSVLLVRNTTIKSLMIGSPDMSIPVGATQQLSLTGLFNDGSTQDLSLTANWQSSNPAVATISSRGVVTAVTGGNVQFSASFGGLSQTTGNVQVLTTDLVSLTIRVPFAVENVGSVQQLSVIGTYANGNTQDLTSLATWASSNTSVLQVSKTGFEQTVGAGRAQITATVANFTTVTSIVGVTATLVSIDILPNDLNFALGTSLQFTALGHYSNGAQFDLSSLVLWSATDPTVLTINANGLAKSGKVGSTTVTASFQGVSQTSLTANVTNATLTTITIGPTSARLAASTHAQFAVTGWFSDGTVEDVTNDVLWTTSAPTVVSVDLDGTVYGVAPGTATLTASAQSVTASVPLTVTSATLVSTFLTPGNFELPLGLQRQVWLVGTFSDGTTQDMSADAIWLSPTPSVTFATQGGFGLGVSPGVGTIGAELGNFTSSTQVNVANVTLTGITLTPASNTIRQQGSQQMNAIGTFSDGYQQDLYLNAVYSATDPALVYIRQQGLAIGTGVGSTQITATFHNLQASTTNFTVLSGNLQSIALTPANPMIPAGGTAQLTATGTYADGSTSDLSKQVTWTSSNPAVLSVDANGLATAHASSTPGTVTVTAQIGSVTQSFTVTISPYSGSGGSITALAVQPASATIGAGSSRQFSATATYADGSTQDVSGTTTWTSSTPAVATINSSGLATGVGTGSTVITATSNGVSANATLTVQSAAAPIATLRSVAVAPSSATINAGSTQLLTATATYSDGTITDVSSSASWDSSNTAVATINSGGVVTGVSAGAATVTASLSGVSGTAALTVNPPTPPGTMVTAITVTPVAATIATHGTQQFTAVATLSSGATQTVTTAASWSSSSPSVATINQAGLAMGVAVGSSAIAATWNGTTGNASLVVNNGGTGGGGNLILTAITITPATTSIALGATQQYVATGIYSDGSTQNITTSATWTSSSSGTASITTAGLATGVAAGAFTITAQSEGISGVAALTVTASTATLTSIVVTPTSSQIVTGLSQQFAATGTYSDGTTRDVSSSTTWSSSNPVVALVSSTGQVTGLTAGVATITCTSGSLQSQTTVIINTATLQSVAISPTGASFAVGATQQLKLTGTFSNGSHVDVTSAATWTALTTTVATVSSTGLVTGVRAGTARISAIYGAQTTSTTVQITAATLVSIAVSPASASFAKGTTQQFAVIGTYSDGTTHDVTGQATFLSSAANVLTVSSTGLAMGAGAGTAQVSISADGENTTTQTITVTPATVVSIAITPSSPTFAKGTPQKFTAIATFSDGTTQDLSNEVVWTSSNPQTATIDDNGLASSETPGSTQISATFQGVTGTSGTAHVSPAVLSSLAVSPATAQIAKGTAQQFTATGTFSDGSAQDLSSSATWSSSNLTVASISASGLATGNSIGATQISAAFGSSSASTSSFQVTPATLVSVAFSPSNPSVAAGTSAQVTVTGTFSDGSTQNLTSIAVFSSSNPAAVTVNSSGVITGVAPGTSNVTVTVDGQTNSFSATTSAATLVSIAITPSVPTSFAKGTTEQFTATGTFSDGSTQDLSSGVAWTTSNPAVYTVDTHGLATGAGTGSATLTAAYQGRSVTTPSVQVTPAVVASIAVTPAADSVVTASTIQYTAIATYTDASTQDVTGSATWSSSSITVATITSIGYALAIVPGSTTIAALYNGITGSTGLTVTPIIAPTLTAITVAPTIGSVAIGNTQQFTATGVYSDGTTQNLTSQATWVSSATGVATVNSSGLTSTHSGGNTQITASYNGVSGVAALTVSPATLVSLVVTPATVTLASGTSQQYTATGTLSDGSTQNLTNSVTWSSSSTGVATINASGLATASGIGGTTITAQAGSVSGTAAMTVTAATVVALQAIPPVVTLPAGGTQQLTVTAEFSDGSAQNVTASATYLSANTGVATVSATGLVTATGAGSSSVMVSLGSTQTTVQVVTTSASLFSLAVTPANASLAVGESQQMTATGTFSNGSTQDLTNVVVWSSSATSIATVSATGNVVINGTGSATITATDGLTTGSTTVTGTTAVVTGIAVSPTSVTLGLGQTQQFTATATLSNGTQQNVTSSATWSTSSASEGTISNVAGTNGLLVATGAGNMIVTATLNSVAGSTSVTVTTALLTSLTVSPSPVSVPSGATQQMTVTGNYSDGSSANVTSSSTWTSSASSVATVDVSGVLHAVSPGTTTVTAANGLVTKQDAVTVTNAVLSFISITPTFPTTPLGVQTQLLATGTYSDGSTTNITSQVQWSSSAPAVATVSSGGLASTVSAGSTQITATLGSISQQIPLTVTSAVLESITVQASQTSFALGLSLPLTAIGTYSDNSTQNLTSLVSWSTQPASIGVVSYTGVATGVNTGGFTAKATLSGVSGTLSLTVTSAVLQSITITPANQLILNVLGAATQYNATGYFSDGSTQNITNTCHWAITAGIALGSISQTGSFSPLGVGLGTITATSGTISGSTGFIVVSVL